jgi:hypothetical protein
MEAAGNRIKQDVAERVIYSLSRLINNPLALQDVE